MRLTHTSLSAWLAAATCCATLPALAQTAAPAQPPAAPGSEKPAAPEAAAEPAAPPPGLMIGPIKLSAQLDAGFMLNPYRPSTGLNWGQLFTDHANQAQLNQLLLTASKPLDPKDPGLQWGMKLQFMYGSDARYTQFLGVFNNVDPGERYQLDLVEANVLAHLPYVTDGGVDLKAGLYSTPLGYETIDPSTNPFYSHSYIFQFGLPFKHTGVLTTAHVSDLLDIYAGVDTGTNTTFGSRGENNSAVAAVLGFGLNGLLDGKLTVLALTHFGPEQPTRLLSPIGVNADAQWRYFNDILLTYKASDILTLVTELNWVRDDFGLGKGAANGFGLAQYVSYTLGDNLTLNVRGEIWRDDNNFFVASFSGNNDPVRFQQGLPTISAVNAAPGGGTTYSGLTLGVTYKPDVPAPISGLLIRPEVRWDHAYTSNKPFNQNPPAFTKGTSNSFTFGADAVLTF
jgi:Putative beta-barrel porin-2, OmpL-like. bbp2